MAQNPILLFATDTLTPLYIYKNKRCQHRANSLKIKRVLSATRIYLPFIHNPYHVGSWLHQISPQNLQENRVPPPILLLLMFQHTGRHIKRRPTYCPKTEGVTPLLFKLSAINGRGSTEKEI